MEPIYPQKNRFTASVSQLNYRLKLDIDDKLGQSGIG